MDRTQAMRYQKINSLLWSFSLPAIVGMVVNSLYNIVDRIFLGRGIGSLAIAATTVAFPIMIILMAVSVLIGVGATALISIRLGEQRQEEAEKVIGTATTMIILLPTIFAFIFFLYFIAILLKNTFIPLIVNFTYSLIFMLAGGNLSLNIFAERLTDASSLGKYVWVSIAAFILLYGGLQMEKHLYKNSI
jgi:Na+-driven multidrug efflux pump